MSETGETVSSEPFLHNTNLSNNKENEKDDKENGIEDGNENRNEEPKKVNSFITVLSIWSSMIGSSTVSIPYNIYMSGIIPGIILCLIYGFLCFYTCKIYVDFGVKEPDFSTTIEKYFSKMFGPKIAKIAKNIQVLFCILVTGGGFLIYFLIMSQNLYSLACLLLNKIGLDIDAKDLTPEFSRFSFIYLGIVLALILFPLTIKKDLSFLIKLSSFGVYFVSILILYMIYTGISSIINTEFHFDYIKNKNGSDVRYLSYFGEDIGLLSGALSLGYFCHTSILPTLKNNKNQNNNIRDLILGYIFSGITFALTGIIGYIGFSGKKFDVTFQKNWFLFFEYDDYYILFFRLLNVFQLGVVFPILVYVVRFQIFNFFYGNDYPSKKLILIYGISSLILCLIIIYFCYDILSELIGVIGATTSLILIYTFPPIIKILSYIMKKRNVYLEIEKFNKVSVDANVEQNKVYEDKEKEEKEETEETEESNKKEVHSEKENESKEEKNVKIKYTFKDILYIFGHICFIIIGIMTVIVQFVSINIFNVTYRNE